MPAAHTPPRHTPDTLRAAIVAARAAGRVITTAVLPLPELVEVPVPIPEFVAHLDALTAAARTLGVRLEIADATHATPGLQLLGPEA